MADVNLGGGLGAERERRPDFASARALRRSRSRLAAAGLALALGAAACSGGGSDEGPTLAFDAGEVSFVAYQHRALPAPQTIHVTVTKPEAAYAIATGFVGAAPAWASTQLFGSGASWTLGVRVTDTSLPPGTYAATLRVGLLRSDDSVITYRDARITYTVRSALTVSQPSLSFRWVAGGPVPAAQQVTLGGQGISWTGTSDRSWIGTSAASGTTPSTVDVSVDPAGLSPGIYDGSLVFSRADGGPSETVVVQLVVEDPVLVASATDLVFSGVNGTAIAPKPVTLTVTSGASVTWTASARSLDAGEPSWIVLSSTTGTTPGELVVSVDPSRGPLASGSYSGAVTLTATVNDGLRDIPLSRELLVTLELARPTLTVTPAALALGGPSGRDLSAREVRLSLGTGGVGYAWTATPTGDAPWVTLDAASGSVSAAGTAVQIGVDVTPLAAGTHQGSVVFSATVNGDVLTAALPVTLALDEHRLLASDAGVAFASMPGLERLSRTLRIRDSFGAATTWTASDDAAWLTVSPGTAPDELVLTADPAGLATDTVHEATVTIAADVSGVAPETVRVGLWVGATAPPATRSVAGAFAVVAMDPVRPFAYVHKGGTDVEVYNVFTGALVRTFARVAPSLGGLAVSTDGTRLFAHDLTNRKVVPLALPAGGAGAGWAVAVPPEGLVYSRTNGKEIVFAGAGYAHDATTGAALDASPMGRSSASVGAASLDGSRFCSAPTGASPHDVVCHALDYTAADGRLIVGPARLGFAQGYDGDVAVNGDGTRVYHMGGVWDAASGNQLQTLVPQGRSFALPRDGRVIVGSRGVYEEYDFRVRDADGFVLASYKVAGYARTLLDAQLEVTGDGLCVAAITDDPKLVFQIIGP